MNEFNPLIREKIQKAVDSGEIEGTVVNDILLDFPDINRGSLLREIHRLREEQRKKNEKQ